MSVSLGRPAPRLEGDWLVATMIYSSPRESKTPGFDRWYWDLLALVPRARKVLIIAGAYDSDGTIKETLDEARKRKVAAVVHFVEKGPLRTAYEQSFASLATIVEDIDTFAEENGFSLDDDDDIKMDF